MSNSIIEILDQVIDNHFKIPSNHSIVIDENQANCSCTQVTLRQVKKAYAFSLDKGGRESFPFFKDGEIKKRNDAIIFCEYNNDIFIFIVELKSNNPNEGIKQIKAGNCFVDFLLKTINLNYRNIGVGNVQIRNVIFHTRKVAHKRVSRKRQQTANYISKQGIEIAFEKCNEEYPLNYFF